MKVLLAAMCVAIFAAGSGLAQTAPTPGAGKDTGTQAVKGAADAAHKAAEQAAEQAKKAQAEKDKAEAPKAKEPTEPAKSDK